MAAPTRAPRRTVGPPPVPDALTSRQRERRDAIVEAAVELVGRHGPDDLQMRDVSERSGAALATLYRYFPSKDQLVAAAFMAWARTIDDRVVPALTDSATPADRFVAVLHRGLRPFQHQPNFARAMIYVSQSRDPFASETYLQLGTVIRGTLARSIPDVEPDVRDGVLQAIGSVWYHCLVEWVSGRITIATAQARLDRAARLLLSGT
ncbi:MAG: TetR/AcrR family transcriptional regulator [Actinomycetia bacterium]|nr:TetR/AcrR family transcriptional regulator [Actinomycetes bacterium]